MIDQNKMEAAMTYLAQTDIEFAETKAAAELGEIRRKRCRSRIFLTTEGTVAERQAQAEVHQDVIDADMAWITDYTRCETLKAKRQRAELVVDVWRSIEASRRKA
jgi:hypothetical protein